MGGCIEDKAGGRLAMWKAWKAEAASESVDAPPGTFKKNSDSAVY
jgi:hypothetical protein